MRSQPPCKTWAEKLALRREYLSPADRETLAAHLQTCPACAAAQEDYHFLDSRLRALPPPALRPLPRLSLQNLLDKEEEDTEKMMKASGRFKIPFRNVPSAAFVVRLILTALLLFGIQSASNNGFQLPGMSLFTYHGHSIYHGHRDYVDAVSWSPDGRYVASGSWDHTVQVWYARTGETLRIYTGHSEFVDAVAWSPNGQFIASGDRNDTVQVWNFLTGKVLHKYPSLYFGGIVEALAWSPDGRYIAAADRDSTVHVLDAHTSDLLFVYEGQAHQVSTLTWSPDSRCIASSSDEGTVQVWNAHTGATLFTFRGHTKTVAAVAWSPDGRYIASGCWDRTVQIWAAPCTR